MRFLLVSHRTLLVRSTTIPTNFFVTISANSFWMVCIFAGVVRVPSFTKALRRVRKPSAIKRKREQARIREYLLRLNMIEELNWELKCIDDSLAEIQFMPPSLANTHLRRCLDNHSRTMGRLHHAQWAARRMFKRLPRRLNPHIVVAA